MTYSGESEMEDTVRIRTLLATAGLTASFLIGSAASVSAQDYGGTGASTQDRKDGGDEVLGASIEREAPAAAGDVGAVRAARAETATLPVTGGDLVGLGVIGVSLIGGGTVLVRRSRRRPVAA